MFIETTEEISLTDGAKRGTALVTLKEGKHEIEVIPSPKDPRYQWFVLVGTKVGAPKSYWEHLINNGTARLLEE